MSARRKKTSSEEYLLSHFGNHENLAHAAIASVAADLSPAEFLASSSLDDGSPAIAMLVKRVQKSIKLRKKIKINSTMWAAIENALAVADTSASRGSPVAIHGGIEDMDIDLPSEKKKTAVAKENAAEEASESQEMGHSEKKTAEKDAGRKEDEEDMPTKAKDEEELAESSFIPRQGELSAIGNPTHDEEYAAASMDLDDAKSQDSIDGTPLDDDDMLVDAGMSGAPKKLSSEQYLLSHFGDHDTLALAAIESVTEGWSPPQFLAKNCLHSTSPGITSFLYRVQASIKQSKKFEINSTMWTAIENALADAPRESSVAIADTVEDSDVGPRKKKAADAKKKSNHRKWVKMFGAFQAAIRRTQRLRRQGRSESVQTIMKTDYFQEFKWYYERQRPSLRDFIDRGDVRDAGNGASTSENMRRLEKFLRAECPEALPNASLTSIPITGTNIIEHSNDRVPAPVTASIEYTDLLPGNVKIIIMDNQNPVRATVQVLKKPRVTGRIVTKVQGTKTMCLYEHRIRYDGRRTTDNWVGDEKVIGLVGEGEINPQWKICWSCASPLTSEDVGDRDSTAIKCCCRHPLLNISVCLACQDAARVDIASRCSMCSSDLRKNDSIRCSMRVCSRSFCHRCIKVCHGGGAEAPACIDSKDKRDWICLDCEPTQTLLNMQAACKPAPDGWNHEDECCVCKQSYTENNDDDEDHFLLCDSPRCSHVVCRSCSLDPSSPFHCPACASATSAPSLHSPGVATCSPLGGCDDTADDDEDEGTEGNDSENAGGVVLTNSMIRELAELHQQSAYPNGNAKWKYIDYFASKECPKLYRYINSKGGYRHKINILIPLVDKEHFESAKKLVEGRLKDDASYVEKVKGRHDAYTKYLQGSSQGVARDRAAGRKRSTGDREGELPNDYATGNHAPRRTRRRRGNERSVVSSTGWTRQPYRHAVDAKDTSTSDADYIPAAGTFSPGRNTTRRVTQDACCAAIDNFSGSNPSGVGSAPNGTGAGFGGIIERAIETHVQNSLSAQIQELKETLEKENEKMRRQFQHKINELHQQKKAPQHKINELTAELQQQKRALEKEKAKRREFRSKVGRLIADRTTSSAVSSNLATSSETADPFAGLDPEHARLIDDRASRNAVSSNQAISSETTDPFAGLDPDHIKLFEGFVRKPDASGSTIQDIAGLDFVHELIESLVAQIEYPQSRPAAARITGLLLYGPSGTGKSLVAEAIVNTLNLTFIEVPTDIIPNRWEGDSEKLIRALYAVARQYGPSIVMFDEGEKFFGEGSNISDGRVNGMKYMLRNEMGRIANANAGVITVCITNFPTQIDHAILSMFKRKYEVPLPTQNGRKDIFKTLLRRKFENFAEDVSNEEFCQLATDTDGSSTDGISYMYNGRDLSKVCKTAVIAAGDRHIELIKEGKRDSNDKPKVTYENLKDALQLPACKPTAVDSAELEAIKEFTEMYNSTVYL